jgi:hypothetical protein
LYTRESVGCAVQRMNTVPRQQGFTGQIEQYKQREPNTRRPETIACCFRLHDWPISDQSTWRTSDARNWFVLVRVSRRGDKSFLRLYSRNHTAASRDRFLKASLLFYAALVGAGFLAYCTWSGTLQKSRAVGPFEDGPPIAAGYAFNI